MLLLPIRTPILRPNDDLAGMLLDSANTDIRVNDIIVVSSKAVATVEGAFTDLREKLPSPTAVGEGGALRARRVRAVGASKIPLASVQELSRSIHRSPAFCAAMLQELERLHGTILGTVPGAALTEVRPKGMRGTILVANAGLDESNAPEGFAIGWPREPAESARKLREQLQERMRQGEQRRQTKTFVACVPSVPFVACVISDSICVPRRSGVTAIALVASGIDPLQPQEGRKDLFDKPLTITTEAVADQLATAANFLMGNAAQSVPAVIIRDHGLTLSEWEGWVPGIGAEEDLFGGIV